MNKYLIGLAIIIFVGVYFGLNQSSPLGAFVSPISSLTYTMTNTTTTAPVTIQSANSGRMYCMLANTGAQTVYFVINTTSTVITSSTARKGTPLAAGATFEITGEKNLTGNIYAVNESGTSTMSSGCN